MPGEFEPHSGCWMAWPERTDNWRLGAKPAQEAFAAVATAIAASEPVTMAVSDAQFENCRAMLPPEGRVVEVSTTTPGCATPARPSSSTARAGGAGSTGASTP